MCDNCDYDFWLDEIRELLDNDDYEFAEDTLYSIQKWVKTKEHITSKQIIAIENIKKCKGRFN